MLEDQILKLDVEMTGRCNLRCPLCVTQQERGTYPVSDVDVEKLEQTISRFPNLELVTVGGVCSEPTLHPRLLDILDWLTEKPFKTELYTNASIHSPDWWKALKNHLNDRSIAVFTVCGTTQALHEKYRVGSDLARVLANVEAFVEGDNYLLQYIRFEYNKNDDVSYYEKKFEHFQVIDTDSCFERRNPDSLGFNAGICMESVKSFRYRRLLKDIKLRGMDVSCYARSNQSAYVDAQCHVYPCAAWRGKPVPGSYAEIEAQRQPCCVECDRRAVDFLEKNNVDAYFMC